MTPTVKRVVPPPEPQDCELCQRAAYEWREFTFPSREQERVYICIGCMAQVERACWDKRRGG